MTQLEASALVDRQRRRWRAQASDKAIARRGERAYFMAAGVQALVVLLEVVLAAWSKRPVVFILAAGISISGVLLFWCSRRFTQTLLLLGHAENFENIKNGPSQNISRT